jgi:RNA-directed DNA polymerase
MKNCTVNSSILSALEACSFFSKGNGIESFPYSQVKECAIGNKYIYKLSGVEAHIINQIHESLISTLLEKLPVNNSATAYLKNKSYLDFLEPHRNNYYFLRIDLKNFFHFITDEMVRDTLRPYVPENSIMEGCSQSSLDAITKLLTISLPDFVRNTEFAGKTILPIGFKTSPIISNIVFRKFDILIEKFCTQHDILYTRYADDMLFSSSDARTAQYREKSPFDVFLPPKNKTPFVHSNAFIEQISFIINLGGFKVNSKKTRSSINNFTINGYTISGTNYPYTSGTVRISNKKTKTISKLLHECKSKLDDEEILKKVFGYRSDKLNLPYKPSKTFLSKYHTNQLNNKIMGYRSYLISFLSFNERYRCMDSNFISKCKHLVENLDKLIQSRVNSRRWS